jgi:hypothetical protein
LKQLVYGAAALTGSGMPPWALVGGLAVMVHITEAHHVTRDVDAVVDDDGRTESVLEVLIAGHGASRRANGVRLANGTDVDLISVGSWTPENLPDDELERMFVLAHWWAVQTAATLDLVVVEGNAGVALATLPVASPAALVATELQSLRGRRRLPGKAVTDVLDAYRLLRAHDRDGGVAAALATAPWDLGPWAARALTETFVEHAALWARRIGVVDAQDLEVVGSLCVERLRRLLG